MKKKIILASASPRRRELLALGGFDFEVITSDADEEKVEFTTPEEYVMALAKLKCEAVEAVLEEQIGTEKIIIAADTIVYSSDFGGKMGKPHDFCEAHKMLSALSGKEHEVLTGICIKIHNNRIISHFADATKVYFRDLSDEEITSYITDFPPYDKAGAYGIQDKAAVFVKKIEGDYFNVMGLPLVRVYTELKQLMHTFE